MGAAPQLQQQIQFTFERMTLFNDNRVNYGKYSKFISIGDFNNEWEQFMVDYKHKFTRLQLDAIRVYRKFAAKEGRIGVVNASYRTLIEASKELYGYEIKRDTFRTAITKLEQLGGCVVADGQRLIKGRGSRTANIVIFNRHNEAVAYQIAKKQKEDAEIARLLEADYATASPVVNYAYNARKWAEEKRLKQAEQAAQEAEKQRKDAEQAAKNKKVSLYRKMAVLLSTKKSLKSLKLKEFVAIAYSNVKNLVAANVAQLDAEEIAYNKLVEVADKENVKNYAALYSWTMKQAVNMLNGEVQTMTITKAELLEKQGKKVEVVPDWLIEQQKDAAKRLEMRRNNEYLLGKTFVQQETETTQTYDFEAERAKILAKLNR